MRSPTIKWNTVSANYSPSPPKDSPIVRSIISCHKRGSVCPQDIVYSPLTHPPHQKPTIPSLWNGSQPPGYQSLKQYTHQICLYATYNDNLHPPVKKQGWIFCIHPCSSTAIRSPPFPHHCVKWIPLAIIAWNNTDLKDAVDVGSIQFILAT